MPPSPVLDPPRPLAAATSSTPESSFDPSPSYLALWMRKSKGYALVPSAC